MTRYLKPLVVTVALLAALFLTISRRGPNGTLGVTAQRTSRAAPDRRGNKGYDLAALRVFTVVLGRIKDHYVEPARLEPKKMLVSALDAIERSVAEVMVEAEKNGKVKVKVQDAEREFTITDVDSPWALSSKMKAILRFLQPHLKGSTDIRDVEYAAINGMLGTLDPHSVLLKPEVYNEMKLSTRGEFGGLGIVISMIKGVLTVMNPMKGTPAHKAGIKSCDQILKIGEESTVNMTLSQAVGRLRGTPGSKVEISVLRAGWKRPVKKMITRAVIKVDSVTSRMLGKKVGYVKLTSFQGNSHSDLRQHVRKLRNQGMKGLVLDLRGNPGGLLDQAIKISDMFIDAGTLLTTVAHAGKQREEKRAKSEGTEDRYPIAVLVNSGSASASEIVAGALKNLDRAVIIGRRTFGKGSVQVLYDNDDGSALKLTIAQYLTPGDISIQSVGITPDIETRPVAVRKDYIKLHRGDRVPREADLRAHLTHRNVRRNVKPAVVMRYLARPPVDDDDDSAGKNKNKKKHKNKNKSKSKSKQDKRDKQQQKADKAAAKNLCMFPDRSCKPSDEDKFSLDFQIKLARDLVAQTKAWRRSQILARSKALFKKRRAEEETAIAEAMKKLGVDWSLSGPTAVAGSATAAAPKPKLSVSVKGLKARACRVTKLQVTVKNDGKVAVERLEAIAKSDNRMYSGIEFVFGRIEPGKSRSWTVPLRVRDAPTRMDALTIKLRDGRGNKYDPHVVQIATQGVARPTFAYGYQLIDDITGNRDGRVQRGEHVRLLVKVRNSGKGRSFRTTTTLKNLSGVGVFIRKGRFVLGELAPGQTKTAEFTLEVQRQFAQSEFKLQLRVADIGLGEYVTDKLKFPVAKAGVGPSEAKGTVRVSVQRASFRVWAAKDAPMIGYAPRGAVFRVLGRTGSWYRVEAEKGRPAFLNGGSVTPGGTRVTRRFVGRFQVTPPKLSINVPSYVTTQATLRISGKATDENRVSDLFIFVRNPSSKIEGRKVFYRSTRHAKNPKELPFSVDIPLWPGANYVTVYARENDEVQTSDTVVIFRKKP